MKKEKERHVHSDKENIKYMFFNWWKVDKKSVILSALRIPAMIILPLVTALIPKIMIDYITENRSMKDMVLAVGFLSLLFAGLSWIGPYLQNKVSTNLERLRAHYQIMLFRKSMYVDYEDIESLAGREKIKRAENFFYGGAYTFSIHLFQLIIGVTGVGTFFAILSSINLGVVAIIIATCFLDAIIRYFLMKKEDDFWGDTSNIRVRFDYMYEIACDQTYAKDVRIYGLKDWLCFFLAKVASSYSKVIRRFYKAAAPLSGSIAITSLLRDIIAYGYLVYCVLYQGMKPSDFIFFFGIISGFSTWLSTIISSQSEMRWVCNECHHFREFIEMKEGTEKGNAQTVPVPTDDQFPCSIEFDHVSFSYNKDGNEVLKDVSFKVEKGENIAIVGENGAGKTTIIKLLCGFYPPTKGKILINGKDISQFEKQEFYTLFSAVFQDYTFLPLSVAENISSAVSEETDYEKVDKVLKESGILERVQGLRSGVKTKMVKELNEDATNFSGGEQQKLLLAKCLYKNAPILILDEPTAALDPIAENQLYVQYDQLSKNKTSFFISHRLSSTKFCDRIFFVANGNIEESGTHDELIEKKGKYHHMFQVQSHYYRTAGGDFDE